LTCIKAILVPTINVRAMNRKTIKLDVRDEIRAGREPFGTIMGAVSRLSADQDLLVIAPFEPRPLMEILRGQGFNNQVSALPEGDFEVRFSRGALPAPEAVAKPRVQSATPITEAASAPDLEVDARSLTPPEPMVRILEAAANLARGSVLRARTNLRPMHLFPQLEERGFVADCSEQADGSFLTLIRHA